MITHSSSVTRNIGPHFSSECPKSYILRYQFIKLDKMQKSWCSFAMDVALNWNFLQLCSWTCTHFSNLTNSFYMAIFSITIQELLDGQEGSDKIFFLFVTDRCAKTVMIWFVTMPISSLLVKFHLNILTFQALAKLQTLLQSFKQNL